MFRSVLAKSVGLVAIISFLFLIADEPAYAIKNIPDGGMTSEKWSGLGEEKRVDPRIERMWKNKQIPRGGKNPAFYSPTKGNNLVYDVYAGTSSLDKKRGFHTGSGGNYLLFNGWAIIQGHHHHAKENQATYIGLVNKKNSNDRLIFKTYMHANTSANPDVWDGQFGKCPPNAFNRPVIKGQKGACNMDYNYTQFRAYIDAREVFGGENAGKEWEMYIIKRVEDKVLYAPLILPFDTKTHNWRDGRVTLRSGEDARTLRMVGTDVIKKSNWNSMRGDSRRAYRHFAPSKYYKSNGVHDGANNRVAVQYRVYDNINARVGGRTYKATNQNKWASSAFWEFGGSIATLSYKKTHATVTIHHVDKKTNKILKTEKVRRKLNETYTRSPYSKGNLKDGNGREIKDSHGFSYVPNPSGSSGQQFSEIIKGDKTIRFNYQASVDVTIRHFDAHTKEVLENENFKRQYSDLYEVSPKERGAYKDAEGNPYVASPIASEQRFSQILKDDAWIDFYYKASLDDPSEEIELPDTTDGEVEGEAFWELRRLSDDEESKVYAEVNFVPTGRHYETRNIKHILHLEGYEKSESEEPISMLVDATSVKDKDMNYDYQYEYTNFYRDNYTCVDEQGEDCFEWEYKDRTPVWEKGSMFSLVDLVKKGEKFVVLKMDHRYGDVIKKDFVEEILSDKFIVGRGDVYEKNKRKSKLYQEAFEKMTFDAKSKVALKTQSHLNIRPDKLRYSVQVPSSKHEKGNYRVLRKGLINGHYFPVDVDESLKEDLENHTDYDYGDYACFLQQKLMQDKGVQDESRVYEMEFVSDYFFVSESTGFITTYPYAYELHRHLKWGDTKPNENMVVERIKGSMEQNYFRQTGQEFLEPIIGVDGNRLEDVDKLQRYYLPVSPESPLEPNETYINKVVLEHIGLNDLTWEYGQEFTYEHYLFGSGHDDAWIVEQSETRISDFDEGDVETIIIKHEDKGKILELVGDRPTEKLHEFRVTDRDFVDKMKRVLDF